jgi:CBS domain-containing protein
VARSAIAGILLVKSVIWAVSLGSGTSGGVLAPLLMMGGALGGLEAAVFPDFGQGFWPLISMGAVFAGTMRSPLTGVLFALEITHDLNSLMPLLLAAAVAHGFTVLLLRRSILTEKISRRGYHLSREYAVDPLEILFVREVMRTNVAALPGLATARDIQTTVYPPARGQHLYPVIDDRRCLVGVITRKELGDLAGDSRTLAETTRKPVVAYTDEPLRVVVNRMAETGLTRMPVVDRSGVLAGMVSLEDLLYARSHNLQEERRRERVLRLRLPFGRVAKEQSPVPAGERVR